MRTYRVEITKKETFIVEVNCSSEGVAELRALEMVEEEPGCYSNDMETETVSIDDLGFE